MRRRRTAALVATVLGAAAVMVCAGSQLAAADTNTIYVQPGPTCSDNSPSAGTQGTPFCSPSVAAAMVQPGQTVFLEPAIYPDTVNITRSGTPTAPITFLSNTHGDLDGTTVGAGTAGAVALHGFTVTGAHDVIIKGFAVQSSAEAYLITDSSRITVEQSMLHRATTAPYIRITGSSSNVTVSRVALLRPGGSAIVIDPGVTNTTITTVSVESPGAIAISATDAPGTVVTSTTIVTDCKAGIALIGTSSGASLMNNVIDPRGLSTPKAPCPAAANAVPISVAAGSVTGTAADYNLFEPVGAPFYAWGGTNYQTLAAFQAATGLGSHDIAADPAHTGTVDAFPHITLTEGSPAIDSANANAPGVLTVDLRGKPRVNDVLIADQGVGGGGFYDRGAWEFQAPLQVTSVAVRQAPGGGPLDVSVEPTVTNPWGTPLQYTYAFQDDSPDVHTSQSSVAHTFTRPGDYCVYAAADNGVSTAWRTGCVTPGVGYTPVTPKRLLDTRTATGTPTRTPLRALGTLILTVGGVAPVPGADDVDAVVLNVTAVSPTVAGFLTVYPDGGGQTTSNLNFTPGQIVPNLVTVPVTNGKIGIFNGSGGPVDIVADVQGYYGNAGGGFKPTVPKRVLDTREGIGAPVATPVASQSHIQLDLGAEVPAGTRAVVLNVTATQPTSSGYLTVYPDGQALPLASNLNFTPGQTVPNLVIVPVVNGKVDLFNGSPGTVHVVADLSGYFGPSTTGATDFYSPRTPQRIADTRQSHAIAPGGVLTLPRALFGHPLQSGGTVTAAVLNVTVTAPQGTGFLTVYPRGQTRPLASNLNFVAGQTVPNLVAVPVAPWYWPEDPYSGGVEFYNGSPGTVQVVVDLQGYYIPPLT